MKTDDKKSLMCELENAIALGYNVFFKRNINQVDVAVMKQDALGRPMRWTSSLPISDHFTEDRLAGVVRFGVEKVHEMLYPVKPKKGKKK